MGTVSIKVLGEPRFYLSPTPETDRWSRALAGNSSGSSPYPCNTYPPTYEIT